MGTTVVTPSLVTFQLILTVITLHLPTQISAGWWRFNSSSGQRLWSESGKKYLVYSIHHSTGSPNHKPTLPKLKWRLPDWTRYLTFGWMSGYQGSLAGSDSKKSTYNAGTWVGSLGWDDPLDKGMAIHSSILAWRIPWTRSLADHSPQGHKESDTTEVTEHTWAWSDSQINMLRKQVDAKTNFLFHVKNKNNNY